MIPVIIQKRGAVHLDEADERTAANILLDSGLNPPRAVLELVPESVARENTILPLRLDGETLTVAAVNPDNIDVRDKLTFILNKKIRFETHPRVDIHAAINRHYGTDQTRSVDSMIADFTDTALEYAMAAHSPSVRPPARSVAKMRRLGVVPADYASDEFDLALGENESHSSPSSLGHSHPESGSDGMFYYTVEEGQRVLRVYYDGRMEVIAGPRRVWRGWSRFERMRHFVAHPGDFLLIRFRDGQQEHVPGPAEIWFDPRIHEQITRQEALQLAAKEAVIVYSRPAGTETISRRIVYGPTLFVPAPGEWLHTFTWHGSEGGSQGAKKIAKGLVFQKLWLMPDQMYHDVADVRTADDAVLTIKLMMFFELVDIERMLEATHDPIGDFINAATSDVVDFTGQRTFEEFKKDTGKLNELEAYRQLTARAAQNGYRVNKVVYRGYGAPDRLQAMHDQALESRTKLQLERATEEQTQNLEDYKLNAMMNRAARRRTEQSIEVDTEIELANKRQDAERRQKESERDARREQQRRDAQMEQEIGDRADDRQRLHLAALKELGVDLTAFLTQGRADRVIELRGKGVNPHLHLDRQDVSRNGD
jgi:hypothetical protein